MGWLRHPRTRQELRAIVASDVDRCDEPLMPKWRGRRRDLPTYYDDIIVRTQRCWKKYRRTQYRPKEPAKERKPSKFRGHLNPRRIAWKTKEGVWRWSEMGQYWYWSPIWVFHYEGVKGSKYRSRYWVEYMKRETYLGELQGLIETISDVDALVEAVHASFPVRDLCLIKELLGEMAVDQTNPYRRFQAERVLSLLN